MNLECTRRKLDTANGALMIQSEELNAQREALGVQQKQLDNTERYFQAEGPVLTANLGLSEDAEPGEREDGFPRLLAQRMTWTAAGVGPELRLSTGRILRTVRGSILS